MRSEWVNEFRRVDEWMALNEWIILNERMDLNERVNDIQRPAGDIQRPAGDIRQPAKGPAGDIQRPAGDIRQPAKDIRRPAGDLTTFELHFTETHRNPHQHSIWPMPWAACFAHVPETTLLSRLVNMTCPRNVSHETQISGLKCVPRQCHTANV